MCNFRWPLTGVAEPITARTVAIKATGAPVPAAATSANPSRPGERKPELRANPRQDMRELRRKVRELRQHVDTQIGNLRDRLERIEGRLDELREFFFRSRGTAA